MGSLSAGLNHAIRREFILRQFPFAHIQSMNEKAARQERRWSASSSYALQCGLHIEASVNRMCSF